MLAGKAEEIILSRMPTQTAADVKKFIQVCALAASRLKKAFKDEQIYVATRIATSAVPFSHLTKAFRTHAAVLRLCRGGFGSEALALSRLVLEMSMNLRWITNQDEVDRSDSFGLFEAKRKQYFALIFTKYSPNNPALAGAIQYVENLYKKYADNYKSFKFWANAPTNLKDMAAEKDVFNDGVVRLNGDDLWNYEIPYSMASDHIHCTSVAMAECYPPECAPYEAESTADTRHVGTAAFSATQNLFAIAVRVNMYRKLDMAHKIDRAYKPFADHVTSHS